MTRWLHCRPGWCTELVGGVLHARLVGGAGGRGTASQVGGGAGGWGTASPVGEWGWWGGVL